MTENYSFFFKRHVSQFLVICLFMLFPFIQANAQEKKPSVYLENDSTLQYTPDSLGNRIPDFSFCGYQASNIPIPDIPVKIRVTPQPGDDTKRIQAAIDYISNLPLDANGFRGTVYLEKGTFEIAGSLHIRTSGVVLRGSGKGEDGTILLASGVDRATLIRIVGASDRKMSEPVQLESKYFPVNSTELSFPKNHPFHIGDHVIVNRPSTKEWLAKLGTDKIGIYVDYHLTKWDPGDFDINWDRTVVGVTPTTITLDVPITNALNPKYGGGNVAGYLWEGRISNVGVENLRCASTFNEANPKDENHRWMAITMDNVRDVWVRRVTAEHFASSAVAVWETASRVTVEDCKSLTPVSEEGNFRRYSFHTLGQQVLFQRCYAQHGYHDFSVGFSTPGPNAFVQCYSYMPLHFSGAIGGWASGVLFDKVTVDGGNISFAYRDVDGQGGGWSAANSVCWQCRAAQLHLPNPPTAQNWAFGMWAQGYGNGNHEESDSFIKPESLFYSQLEARSGEKSEELKKLRIYHSTSTSAPLPEYAAEMSERSKTPDVTMNEWIDQMIDKYPIQSDLNNIKTIEEVGFKIPEKEAEKDSTFHLKNGWLVIGGHVATGRINRTSMWRGSTRPSALAHPTPNLVRFVPGRIGRGLTDDLDTLVNDMLDNQVIAINHYPALWYERRRDDHARTVRADADVWTPFYEQPFSRSGLGQAADRLSKYDLNLWNTWYWLRLKQFANMADEKGLLLIQDHYLQHNIIEEGAHWMDYPWRSLNNINNLGFAEPPHFAGDKRIYMADEFYDTNNPVRKKYHQQYIQKCLGNFRDNANTIHDLGAEYTGPLHFAQFWLDEIAKWEKINGKNVLVMLPGTKDVQDAILNDPVRSAEVDLIHVLQWHYRSDGSLYAPEGGESLAGRQYARIIDPGKVTFEQVYRAVYEFHQKYPEKGIIYTSRGVELGNWASFMAGGSLSDIPPIANDRFLIDAAAMTSLPNQNPKNAQWILGQQGTGYILFAKTGQVNIDLSDDKTNYVLRWINPKTGEIIQPKSRIKGGSLTQRQVPFEGAGVAWLSKK